MENSVKYIPNPTILNNLDLDKNNYYTFKKRSTTSSLVPHLIYQQNLKKEGASNTTASGCFSKECWVDIKRNGIDQKEFVSNLVDGDLIKSFNTNTKILEYARFVDYCHIDDNIRCKFLLIQTKNGCQIEITEDHYILKNDHEFVFAKELLVGDFITRAVGSNDYKIEEIETIKTVYKRGLYAPLTSNGNIIINDIFVSCYASAFSEKLAHCVMLPLIFLNKFFSLWMGKNEQGIHSYCKFLLKICPV